MWAITSFFNPAKYRRRLINFRLFRERLGVPLVAAELSFGGPFELGSGDADVLVQLRGGDMMWQKERLLNIALEHVPASCEYVAWMDADVVFDDCDWHLHAREMLQKFSTVHLFESAYNLPAEFPETLDLSVREAAGRSIVYLVEGEGQRHLLTEEDYGSSHPGESRTGLAWSARAEIVRRHGLYDCCVIGAGDRTWHATAAGVPELAAVHCRMGAGWREHYLGWARAASRDVGGRLSWLPLRINHLWHGSRENRRLDERYGYLAGFDFDPRTDLTSGESGCWNWSSGKREMHRLVADYFAGRREDQS